MEQITRIGMDTSKHIFQLHGVNAVEAPILRKKLRRKDMMAFFAKLNPTVIAIEACGASHHWARLLQWCCRPKLHDALTGGQVGRGYGQIDQPISPR